MDLVNVSDLQVTVEKKKMFVMLPNEMLRKVLFKLDVQPLMALRCVCKRWNAMIEHICHNKSSLVVVSSQVDDDADIASYSRLFNGLVDFSQNSAILTVARYTVNDSDRDGLIEFFSLGLAKLFPSVENVVIEPCYYTMAKWVQSEHFLPLLKLWSASVVTLLLPQIYPESQHPALFDGLNQMTALKRLHFYHLDLLSPATLARLEHTSFASQEIADFVPHLTANFISLRLTGLATRNEITQLVQHGEGAMKELTHLAITFGIKQHQEHGVVSLICDNLSALRMLRIRFYESHDYLDTFAQLWKLTQLSNLSLDGANINMDYMARPNLPTLNSVQTFSLTRFKLRNDQGDRWVKGGFDLGLFCRALSAMMPNLARLTIKHHDDQYLDEITQNLNHFANLRVHDIALLD